MTKKTYLHIDGTNLFAGQNDLKLLKIPTFALFLPNRFSLEMSYKAEKAYVLNFNNKFKSNRKLPRQLKIVAIKKPRMVNIRGK